jgi:hypothetical protein
MRVEGGTELLDRRAEGRSRAELAGEWGGTPDALRMLHARANARIRREFLGAV